MGNVPDTVWKIRSPRKGARGTAGGRERDFPDIILCSDKDDAVVEYALGGINARAFASKYLTQLPDPETLRREILETKHALETRATGKKRKN